MTFFANSVNLSPAAYKFKTLNLSSVVSDAALLNRQRTEVYTKSRVALGMKLSRLQILLLSQKYLHMNILKIQYIWCYLLLLWNKDYQKCRTPAQMFINTSDNSEGTNEVPRQCFQNSALKLLFI